MDCVGLVDGFRSASGFGVGNGFSQDNFRLMDCFVLVYSIGQVDCFGLVNGFMTGGWFLQ